MEKKHSGTQHKNPWIRSEKSMIKLKKILFAAKKLYYEENTQFSMRELAKRLDIGVSNLYRYVQNKRELWFAVIALEYHDLLQQYKLMEQNFSGSSSEFLLFLVKTFITFARNEYPRFYLMFLMKPPISDKDKGPFEEFQDPQFSKYLFSLFQNIQHNEQIKIPHPEFLAMKVWSLIMGVIIMESSIYDYYQDVDPLKKNEQQYFDYILKSIREMILENK